MYLSAISLTNDCQIVDGILHGQGMLDFIMFLEESDAFIIVQVSE